MRPPTTRAVTAAVLLGVTLASGCGVRSEPTARTVSDQDAPERLTPPPPSGGDDSGLSRERLFLVRDGVLVGVNRTTAQRKDATATLADLLAGPTTDERMKGLTTALPAEAGVLGVRLERDLALVTLSDQLSDSGRSDQVLALAQVVSTLDALPEVTAVRFLQGGLPLNVPRGDGVLATYPLTAADYAALRSP